MSSELDLQFGDFEIVKTLGKGSAGIAELARQKSNGDLICLKVIEGAAVDASQTQTLNKSTLDEIKVMQGLHHPHVIAYIGCFEHRTALYVAMEYAEGGDLEKLWIGAQKRARPFEETQVMQWTYEISQALQYVHSMKVLHRDLKLANVLLDKQMRVKLADFGLARTLDTQSYLAQTMCGTPYYISPELCRGDPYGSKSDIWALGCMLYELLCLKRPFNGNNLHGLVLKICTAEPAPLQPARSKACTQLLASLLKKDVTQRPRAADLVQHPLFSSFAASQPRRNSTEPGPGRTLSAAQRMKLARGGSAAPALPPPPRQSQEREPLSPAQRIKRSQAGGNVLEGALGEDCDSPYGNAGRGQQANRTWSMNTQDAIRIVEGTQWHDTLNSLVRYNEPRGSPAVREKFAQQAVSGIRGSAPPLVAALLVLQRVSPEPVVRDIATCALRQIRRQGGLVLDVSIPQLHTQQSVSGTDEFTLFDMLVRVDLGAAPIPGMTQEYTHTTIVRRYSQFRDFNDSLKKSAQTSAAVKASSAVVRDFPGKFFFNNFDAAKIEQRRVDLEKWIKAVVATNGLDSCDLLGNFMKIPPTPADIDQARKTITSSNGKPLVFL